MNEHEKWLRESLRSDQLHHLEMLLADHVGAVRSVEARGFARAREQAAGLADEECRMSREAEDAAKARGQDDVARVFSGRAVASKAIGAAIRAMEDGGAPDVAAASRGQTATFTLEVVEREAAHVMGYHDPDNNPVMHWDDFAKGAQELLRRLAALRKVKP